MASPPIIATAALAAWFREIAAESEGAPYWYGHLDGDLPPWPMKRADCSYLARRLLQRAGIMRHTQGNCRAIDLANMSDALPVGQQAPADFWFGGSSGEVTHVTVVVGFPEASAGGHSATIGANGGGSTTLGNDPDARVRFEEAGYWSAGFITYGRLKPEHRAGPADGAIIKALLDAKAGKPLESRMNAMLNKYYGGLMTAWGRA